MIDFLSYTFAVIVVVSGVLAAFAIAIYGLGWALQRALRACHLWYLLLLVVAIRRHGKDYADRLFWEAVAERASKGGFQAEMIASYAMRYSPDAKTDAASKAGDTP